MTNGEKFKTPKERSAAFVKSCKGKCSQCKYFNLELPCHFSWLADEYNGIDLPFRVQPIFGGGSIIIETVKCSKVIDEVQGLTAQRICSALNDAAIAWHEHMMEKGE